MKQLLAKGASPNASSVTREQPWEFSVLNMAAATGATGCALELVQHGADVTNSEHDVLATDALVYAAGAEHCDPTLVTALIAHGANPNTRQGLRPYPTALEVAASQQNLRCVQALIVQGADVNAPGARLTQTALMWAQLPRAIHGHDRERMTQLLLDHGADPNTPGRNGFTALFFAAALAEGIEPCPNCVKLLIDAGANPNVTNDAGNTPLLWILNPKTESSADAVKVLIGGGADVNLGNRNTGETPLMAAAEQDLEAIVWILLDNGADRCAKDKLHRTAADYAKAAGHTELAQTLACNAH